MRSAKLCLMGTALLLLAGPVLAGPSSRSERETTRQLNRDQTRLAERANQSAAPQFTDASAALGVRSAPAAAPTTPIESAAITNPDGEAPVTLSAVTTPPAKMATANVLDAAGQTVGAVQRVDLDANGAPAKVSVALIGGDRLLVLDAGQVKYDPVRNAILAAQPLAQMKAMAAKG